MKIFQIAKNTIFQAARMKFALAFMFFLAAVIIFVPFVLKGDGTQRGMVQISLAYSMSALNIILSLQVIFLSTSLFCADIRDRVVFTLDTKPVCRWQYILGKFLGISFINIAVLAVLGGGVYGLAAYLGRPGAAQDEQDYLIMRSEVLTARARSKVTAGAGEREFAVPFNTEREWVFEGVRPASGEEYFTLRFKQHSAAADDEGEISGIWVLGDIGGDYHVRALSFPGKETNEFRVPVVVIEENGIVRARWRNLSRGQASVIFPASDMAVLYTAGGFGGNMFRSLLMVFLRLTFLAAVGLASSTFLTLPVAALLTLFVFLMSLSLPTVTALFLPGLAAVGSEAAARDTDIIMFSFRRVLAGLLQVLPNLRAYDPVPSLSDGLLIPWMFLARAFLATLLFRTGAVIVLAVMIFNKRELANMGYDL